VAPGVLQIAGTRHWIIVREVGHITIGCEHHPVEWWEEHYAAVGRREGYNSQQVEEYREHIQYCKEWMADHGILTIPAHALANQYAQSIVGQPDQVLGRELEKAMEKFNEPHH